MALPSMSWMLLSCLMLLSQVQGEISLPLASPRISCPRGSKAYASYCYAFFTTPKSWIDADLACQKRSEGYLASVLSGAEASFVSSLVKSSVNSYSYVWIGLHDPTLVSSILFWLHLKWLLIVGFIRSTSSTHFISSSSAGFLRWRDYSCDRELPYVCKFKG
uniref:C-type lectin domain-containing protein n=1 Tax=Urocitellus parryii TaxID=9999 RepID=A0A8D2GFV7_UROPR